MHLEAAGRANEKMYNRNGPRALAGASNEKAVIKVEFVGAPKKKAGSGLQPTGVPNWKTSRPELEFVGAPHLPKPAFAFTMATHCEHLMS